MTLIKSRKKNVDKHGCYSDYLFGKETSNNSHQNINYLFFIRINLETISVTNSCRTL